ncbi:amidohydrolase family protein [Sediminibacillus dalangtanensis]|uniref:Amidohydrolase family protein n=1 Tax=Sediminibacillus dalangtanensis TaxID=2729421 RepID=A0ABX7VT17_9BACI|nr:amidohydrolase [Sediminibacillus dalangtanensis]QTN00087.1 amidohydrolase family protein [Sediminibacillus dalangtanensis]
MGTIWQGGTIYTMISEMDTVEAVFTEEGKVVDTGSVSDLKRTYRGRVDKVQDLQGNTMFPGFTDSHLHIIGHGEKLIHLDLSAMKSVEEVKAALRSRVSQLEPGEWLIGEGWNENHWKDPVILQREELDEISPENPMMLTRICRHALLANSLAMEQAGINDKTENPQGGVIVRNTSGKATGYFLDTAQEYIKNVIPEMSEEHLTAIVQTAVDDLHRNGLVGGHTEDLNYYGGFLKTYHAFTNGIDGVKRKFRAHLLVHHEVIDDMASSGLDYHKGTEFIEMGAMKIFSDGALGGRTAWLSEPYDDDPENAGINIHSMEDLEALVQKARGYGMPVAVHAIGDKAVEAVAETLRKYPLGNGRRDRIIHAQIVNDRLLDLLTELDVVLDIQPTFVASDFPWIIDRIGKQRLTHAYAWKTFLERDIPCAAGSDAPIESINPLLGIEAAVLRKSSVDGVSYQHEQRLSMYEAISLYTNGSAYASCHEFDQGKIAPGYNADFTILDQDPFTIDPEQITTLQVQQTVVDETVVYQKYHWKAET